MRSLPPCTQVRKVAELGWLVRRVQSLTYTLGAAAAGGLAGATALDAAMGGGADGSIPGSGGGGLGPGRVQQAFCCAAQHELRSYLKLMAYLESFLGCPIPTPGGADPAGAFAHPRFQGLCRVVCVCGGWG